MNNNEKIVSLSLFLQSQKIANLNAYRQNLFNSKIIQHLNHLSLENNNNNNNTNKNENKRIVK